MSYRNLLKQDQLSGEMMTKLNFDEFLSRKSSKLKSLNQIPSSYSELNNFLEIISENAPSHINLSPPKQL